MKSTRLKDEWNKTPDKGILPQEMKERMWKNIRKATINKRKTTYKWLAAACVVLLSSISGYQTLIEGANTTPEAIVTKTFPADIRLLRLPDGTRVWVNENTELNYPEKFADNERTVTLKGEAFFEVKRDPSKPFIIKSGAIKTTVLGTSFNINAYAGSAPIVTVRTGKVKVTSKQSTVFLFKGDAAIYNSGQQLIAKQQAKILEPEWKKVLIDIDGYTLDDVIKKLQSDYSFSVRYNNSNLKLAKLKGTLDTRQGLAEMLQTIAFALNIQVISSGQNTYIINN